MLAPQQYALTLDAHRVRVRSDTRAVSVRIGLICAVQCAAREVWRISDVGELLMVAECDAITAAAASTTPHNTQPPSSLIIDHARRTRPHVVMHVCPYGLWRAQIVQRSGSTTTAS